MFAVSGVEGSHRTMVDKTSGCKGIYISRDWFLELTAQNNIFSVPTVIFYRQGKEQFRQSGYFSLDHILEKAETILQM